MKILIIEDDINDCNAFKKCVENRQDIEIVGITDSDIELLDKQLSNSKVVAVGEIGLDYYWVKDNKETQKELFLLTT